MEATLLEQGVELMFIGMGTVFVFLTCLVAATSLMSWLVQRYRPAVVDSDDVTEQEIAAISAAIAQHRRR
jgi:oxaloacetate decarboxylase gamma subunit